MKTVFFSHGDKGGVGKSIVASALADWIFESGHRMAIFEADGGIPDVQNRFGLAVKSGVFSLSSAGTSENAAAAISSWVEGVDLNYIVVNLPANASEMLDGSADVLLEVFAALDYQVKATWSLGKSAESAAALASSMKKGLMGRLAPENRLVLYPAFQGDPSTFAPIPEGLQTAVMPALGPGVVRDAVFSANKPFSALLNDRAVLNTHGRIVTSRWVAAAREALRPLFPELP